MKKLLTLLFFFPLFALGQTCDVDLIGYDVETNQVSIAILNGENCGCNEYTQQDGNTCDESSGSAVNNNESITHFVFGLHIYEDFTDGPCSQANFHPGWAFAYPPDQTMLPFTGGHVTGDTLNVELNTFFDWDCLLEQDFDEECLEMVVWQINLGQTVDIEDFPTEYWTDTCGTCANQTQMYPDIDLSNNTLVWCPDELPPSPLYPGCTDEEADNYDPIATFNDGSCEYTILGCLNPIACNYNDEATVDDGSCIVCDTPNGEELCNAYHNSDGYWDYYIDLFNCPLTGDITMDTLVIVEADCDVFNLGVTCNEGIRFHTTYTNTGLDSIYTWKITWTGPNGFIAASDQGVDGDQPPPYNVPLPPGITAPTINTITTQMLWQEGDTLCATASLVGQIELTPENNTVCVTLPAYPICVLGCTDPLASNYNPNATCGTDSCVYVIPGCTDVDANNYNQDATEDDGSCIYDITALLYIDTECDLNCNDTLAWYNAIIYFENVGNTIITDFCIEWDIIGFNQEFIECFEGELLPGEDITIEISPITSDGTGGIVIRLLTLNGEEVDVTWFQPISCYQQALATCIYGCTDPNASNYDPNAEWDNGSCEYNIYGCTNDTALNYNPDANVDDGSCIYDIPGCTDPSANNYNPLATINDGSCTYDILGCTDPNALNYNPAANVDDGSCEYPIPGCTDPAAINYNPLATVDDSSCTYLAGCTDPEALNYNSLAILDDGSCVYPPEDCDGSYFAPNTFTPNNDGYNDGWAVIVADPDCWRTWNVQIFNRWGGLVWESNNLDEIWQGNTFNGDYYVSDGVYVYKIIGIGWDPSITFNTTGSITIFR
jgi:gliding motility-associated-like protein